MERMSPVSKREEFGMSGDDRCATFSCVYSELTVDAVCEVELVASLVELCMHNSISKQYSMVNFSACKMNEPQ